MMFEPLLCPDCSWKTTPKHKRPKFALVRHRQAVHGQALDGSPEQPKGFLVTYASGEQEQVAADSHEETMDSHWFFRDGVPKVVLRRVRVREVASV